MRRPRRGPQLANLVRKAPYPTRPADEQIRLPQGSSASPAMTQEVRDHIDAENEKYPHPERDTVVRVPPAAPPETVKLQALVNGEPAEIELRVRDIVAVAAAQLPAGTPPPQFEQGAWTSPQGTRQATTGEWGRL